ncbi:MAG TPA: DUF2203 domain-containing protein [Candidatus Limnocylindria bacterium]
MDDDPTYTLEQARSLLPVIRGTILQLALERRRADDAHDQLHHRLRHETAGRPGESARLEAATTELRARVRDLLDHLESLGIVVRDLDEGLVDIPTVREGERVWLCWRLSDPELGFWHSTREGFSSRQPL